MRRNHFPKILTLAFALTVVMSLNSFAQLLDNSSGNAFTDQPFFNKKIISKNKIKSISGSFIHYKLGDGLRETDDFRAYYFNEKGQLTQQSESREIATGQDTLVSLYEYDDKGNLIALRQRDQYGFYAHIYEYDENNRVINEEYRRNLNKNKTSVTHFELGR